MNLDRHPRVYFALTLIIVYIILAFAVNARLLAAFDLSSIEWLQIAIPRLFDLPFSILSFLGSFEISTVLVLVILFILFRPRFRMTLFALFLAMVAVEWLGKHLIFQPGPPDQYLRMIVLFPTPTGSVNTPFSFPSGHAARSAFITVVLMAWIQQCRSVLTLKRILIGMLLIAELVMLISRVYLGEHWFSDVAAGTALGVVCALPVLADRLDP